VAVHPLRPAKDRWLGEPLPHQLPNPAQAHHKADFAFQYLVFYPKLYGRFSRVTHPYAMKHFASFDLHVLSLLLAFILSQDQTRMFCLSFFIFWVLQFLILQKTENFLLYRNQNVQPKKTYEKYLFS